LDSGGFCWILLDFTFFASLFANDFPLHSPRSPVQRGDGPSFNGWWFGLGLNDGDGDGMILVFGKQIVKVMSSHVFGKLGKQMIPSRNHSVTAHFGVL